MGWLQSVFVRRLNQAPLLLKKINLMNSPTSESDAVKIKPKSSRSVKVMVLSLGGSLSMVGSIGVVLTHIDRSGEMANKGLKTTFIYAGAHKVDGHPFGPLSEAVRADLQTEVAKFYDAPLQLKANHGIYLIDDFGRAESIGQRLLAEGRCQCLALCRSVRGFTGLQSSQQYHKTHQRDGASL